MTTIENGGRGRVLVMAPPTRTKLASIIKEALDAADIKQAAEISSLSPETITTRASDTGKSDSGQRMAVWSLVGMCDGLGLDPIKVGKRLGVTLTARDLAHSRDVIEGRKHKRRLLFVEDGHRRQEASAALGSRVEYDYEPARHADDKRFNGHDGNGHEEGVAERFAAALVGNVAKRLEPEIERMIEAKLSKLLTSI